MSRRDGAYLSATWHPTTRRADLGLDEPVKWIGLEILATEAGGPGDTRGKVEFIARYKVGGRAQRLHEVSRFQRREGRWFYVDGDLAARPTEETPEGRLDPGGRACADQTPPRRPRPPDPGRLWSGPFHGPGRRGAAATPPGCRGGDPPPAGRSPVRVAVEVADDGREQAAGLMHRTLAGDGEGMLFVFPGAAQRAFWMRNTPASLDLLFLSPELRLVALIPRAEPMSDRILSPKAPAQYVLEVPGGFAERHGVAFGAQVPDHTHALNAPRRAWSFTRGAAGSIRPQILSRETKRTARDPREAAEGMRGCRGFDPDRAGSHPRPRISP